MKSLTTRLLQLACSVLTDAASCAPISEADFNRLRVTALDRGLGLFTLDLPQTDDFLTRSLAAGRFSGTGPLTRRRSKQDCRPRFLHGLWSAIFEPTGVLKGNPCPTSVYMLRQIFCLGRKIEVQCSPSRLQQTLREYHEIEARMEVPVLAWSEDELPGCEPAQLTFSSWFRDSGRDGDHRLFGRSLPDRPSYLGSLRPLEFLAREVSSAIGLFDLYKVVEADGIPFRHGPGAVADGSGRGFYKFRFPNWPAKLQGEFPFDYCGSHTMEVRDTVPPNHEPPSRLIQVPKTAKGPRLIAAEPTAHQWCQQLLAGFLVQRMRDSFIGDFVDVRDQEPSRRLALVASDSGDLATVDLSSASDRLSLRLVEAVFGSNLSLLRALHACRTRWTRDDISSPPVFRILRKFSTQGSAVIFPLQSLVFLTLALAACGCETKEDIQRLRGKVRVFGDDVILPNTAYEKFRDICTSCGLKVNERKSFFSGHFRESCGVDGFMGCDVTPVKPKSLDSEGPRHIASLVELSNNLHVRGCWIAAQRVKEMAEEARRFPVVGVDDGLLGFTSFCGFDPSGFQTRWCSALQRYELRLPTLTGRQTQVALDNSSSLLDFFSQRWSADRPRSVGIRGVPTLKLRERWVDAGSLN